MFVTYSNYTCVIQLEDKKNIKITNTFQNIFDEFGCKPSKIDGEASVSRSMKSCLHDNVIEMYSTDKEGRSVVFGDLSGS